MDKLLFIWTGVSVGRYMMICIGLAWFTCMCMPPLSNTERPGTHPMDSTQHATTCSNDHCILPSAFCRREDSLFRDIDCRTQDRLSFSPRFHKFVVAFPITRAFQAQTAFTLPALHRSNSEGPTDRWSNGGKRELWKAAWSALALGTTMPAEPASVDVHSLFPSSLTGCKPRISAFETATEWTYW
ncbi:hypothetical protein V8F33_014128 [Rhypophila sp. PSN 637]